MFNFRLQRVLELRAKEERDSAARLAEARNVASAAREAQDALEAVHSESIVRLESPRSGGAPIGELRNMSYVVEALNRQIQEARSVSEAADETVRRLVAEFTTAFRDRRVLDLLRERKHDEWKAGELQSDRQAMDGVALARFSRGEPTTTGGS